MDHALKSVLKAVRSKQLGQEHVSAHSLRVGCCAALFSSGATPGLICLWCGWSIKGGSYTDYVRLLPPSKFARQVFAQLFASTEAAQLSDGMASLKEAIHTLAAQVEA